MNDKEKMTKRKDWVKNAAIIFLTIMLILTFFSNTIMNYSLPEVATQYVERGTITAKVRGTGVIEASDPYNLIINDTRVIESIAVHSGDEVEKGDTIFVLEEKESEELKAAREELEALETALDNAILAYETKILDGTLSAEILAGVQKGKTESLSAAQAKVQAAKDKLTNLQKTKADYEVTIANITTQETMLANSESYDAAALQAAVTGAQQQVNAAQAELDKISAQVTALEATLSSIGSQADADAGAANAEHTLEAAKNVVNIINTNKSTWDGTSGDGVYKSADDDARITDTAEVTADAIKGWLAGFENSTWDAIIISKQGDVAKAQANYNAAKELAATYSSKQAELANLRNAKASAEQNVVNATQTLNNLNAGSSSTDVAAKKKALADQKVQITAAMTDIDAQIAQAEKEQAQVLADVAGELNLDFQNGEVARAREKVDEKEEEIAKLEEETANPVITAPVSGKITSLSYAAGETTKPGEPAAVIQVAGKGFTASFPVTIEQAKKVNVGDVAELQNSWYYNDLTATLTAIKPDTTNPTQNRLLVFDVTGEDVTPGQSISLSVGQKSADYEFVVPNSAIREDNNGKFILIVESKSSPLGNRYVASRVDVEVVASDDTKSAVSGALEGYEFVITTSTKPVEAGQYVRLPDEQ